MSLTIAVTHFNRYEMVLEAVDQVLGDVRVDEVLISDDCSTDGSWEKLVKWAARGAGAAGGRVSLYRNDWNVDCYRNKMMAVQRARSSWVVLLDSDNVLPVSYLDALDGVRPWINGTAYLPVQAQPEFDYTAFAGQVVSKWNVAELVDVPMFTTALNTANYVVPRGEYLEVWNPSEDPRTVDSLYMNYRWLAAGYKLEFVPGMTYTHRMHPGSHFLQNHKPPDELRSRALIQKLRELH